MVLTRTLKDQGCGTLGRETAGARRVVTIMKLHPDAASARGAQGPRTFKRLKGARFGKRPLRRNVEDYGFAGMVNVIFALPTLSKWS